MSRGKKKQTLLDSDLPIKTTDEEEGLIPFFLIDDTHGVYAAQFSYQIVELQMKNRTVKSSDNKPEYIERYPCWSFLGDVGTFESAIDFYLSNKERELNARQVKKRRVRMSRGKKKQTLLDSDLPIKTTDEEEGLIPFFLIDDTHGVYAAQFSYQIVELQMKNRTVKSSDNKPEYIERYPCWSFLGDVGTFESAIDFYLSNKERELNARQVKNKDYKKLIETQYEIREIMQKAFDLKGQNADVLSFSELIDYKARMIKQIKDLNEQKKVVEQELNSLMEFIKDKRRIIVQNTEPKKHRVKLED